MYNTETNSGQIYRHANTTWWTWCTKNVRLFVWHTCMWERVPIISGPNNSRLWKKRQIGTRKAWHTDHGPQSHSLSSQEAGNWRLSGWRLWGWSSFQIGFGFSWPVFPELKGWGGGGALLDGFFRLVFSGWEEKYSPSASWDREHPPPLCKQKNTTEYVIFFCTM